MKFSIIKAVLCGSKKQVCLRRIRQRCLQEISICLIKFYPFSIRVQQIPVIVVNLFLVEIWRIHV